MEYSKVTASSIKRYGLPGTVMEVRLNEPLRLLLNAGLVAILRRTMRAFDVSQIASIDGYIASLHFL
jgi:hypothetical protein